MPLYLLPKQLRLWPLKDRALVPLPLDWTDDGREERTGQQWLKAVRAYCLERAGDCWRDLNSKAQRNSPGRWWYLNGAKAVSDLLCGAVDTKPAGIQLALPVLNAAPSPDGRAHAFDDRNRRWLVRELMRWNPSLTDRVTLSHLSHEKLVRMLLAAQDAVLNLREAISA
jgi:hypothetical protein